MQAEAFAKVNLSLRVRPPDHRGMHPIRSLAHSIDWADLLILEEAGEDAFVVEEGADVPIDGTNLALRALEAVRRRAGVRRPVTLRLRKEIPVAAGLGGGSADAAAVLALAGRLHGVDGDDLEELAEPLGADVPFCLAGGAAVMEGHGERLRPVPPLIDAALAVVVPPLSLATPDVYRRWDRLDGPQGPTVGRRHLPDSLREFAPLTNDLVPAAVDLAPDLGDWMAAVSGLWGVPVLMTGSGPALFGLFPEPDEAEGAVRAIDGVRAARACLPVGRGRRESVGGTLA